MLVNTKKNIVKLLEVSADGLSINVKIAEIIAIRTKLTQVIANALQTICHRCRIWRQPQLPLLQNLQHMQHVPHMPPLTHLQPSSISSTCRARSSICRPVFAAPAASVATAAYTASTATAAPACYAPHATAAPDASAAQPHLQHMPRLPPMPHLPEVAAHADVSAHGIAIKVIIAEIIVIMTKLTGVIVKST